MAATAETALKSYTELYIGGQWCRPSSPEVVEVISPATEEVLATFPDPSIEDAERAVAAARKAFDEGPWPHLSIAERAEYLTRILEAMRERAGEINRTFSAEGGIPIVVAPAYQRFADETFEDYARIGREYQLEDVRTQPKHGRLTIIRQPVGVVLGICPWNAPMPMLAMKMAPALLAGCTVVMKPAQEDPIETLVFAEALDTVGLPEGVVSILPANREVGAHLVRHPGVDKVTFTGSTASGKQIMADCAQRVARVTLEMGGKSAAIILDDAEPADVIPSLVPGLQAGCGQICVALTRVLVPERRRDEWVDALSSAMAAVPLGDPSDPDVLQGPLISARQRERVEDYVRVGVDEGARVVIGGGRPAAFADRGFFFEATLFDGVQSSMRIAREEIFGPVACVQTYKDDEDALRIANDTTYGLAGSVFSPDRDRAFALARRVRAGAMHLNGQGPCTLEPFGGFKESGLGREGGREGLEPFFEIQQILEA